MGGDSWGAGDIRLIAKPMSRKKATEIWNPWEPYLAHPPSSPVEQLQVQEATINVLSTLYKHGPGVVKAVKDTRDYAEASLTIAAFAENTNIILEEDPAKVPPHLCPPRDALTQVP